MARGLGEMLFGWLGPTEANQQRYDEERASALAVQDAQRKLAEQALEENKFKLNTMKRAEEFKTTYGLPAEMPHDAVGRLASMIAAQQFQMPGPIRPDVRAGNVLRDPGQSGYVLYGNDPLTREKTQAETGKITAEAEKLNAVSGILNKLAMRNGEPLFPMQEGQTANAGIPAIGGGLNIANPWAFGAAKMAGVELPPPIWRDNVMDPSGSGRMGQAQFVGSEMAQWIPKAPGVTLKPVEVRPGAIEEQPVASEGPYAGWVIQWDQTAGDYKPLYRYAPPPDVETVDQPIPGGGGKQRIVVNKRTGQPVGFGIQSELPAKDQPIPGGEVENWRNQLGQTPPVGTTYAQAEKAGYKSQAPEERNVISNKKAFAATFNHATDLVNRIWGDPTKVGMLSRIGNWVDAQKNKLFQNDPDWTAYQSLLDPLTVKIARALGDVGALTESDKAGYRPMIPGPGDTPAAAQAKWQEVSRILSLAEVGAVPPPPKGGKIGTIATDEETGTQWKWLGKRWERVAQ